MYTDAGSAVLLQSLQDVAACTPSCRRSLHDAACCDGLVGPGPVGVARRASRRRSRGSSYADCVLSQLGPLIDTACILTVVVTDSRNVELYLDVERSTRGALSTSLDSASRVFRSA